MTRGARSPSVPSASRAAAAALLAALAAGRVAADDGADVVRRSYQVRDDDGARFDAIEFRRHAERGEWRSAILKLQELLDLPPERSVVVRVEGARPVRFENSRAFALRLFESLPPDGRATWEELERRPAEDLLQRGLRLRRPEDLAAAARRYPARDVRRRAHDALAQLALAQGDFDRAGRELVSLLEVVEPSEAAGVHARLAFARAQQGDAEGVGRVLTLSAPHHDDTVAGPAGPEPLGAFVRRMLDAAFAGAGRFSGARQFGGDRHGSGVSEPPPAVESFGWTAGTELMEGEENDDRTAWTRPVRPVVAQGLVLANNGLSLSAWELASGRPLWRHETSQKSPEWRDHPQAIHTVSVADGVAYAALATRADRPNVERRFYGRIIIYSLPHRALHAFDARTGSVLWSHETSRLEGRADAAEVDRESVASPPLVVGDDVIVSAWSFSGRYDVKVVCYDRHTGATRWRTSVVHGQQEMNLFGRPVKELATTSLAERDGRIYLATGVGIAAALDRVTGAVEWLTEYEQTDIPQTYAWYETRDREITWRPSPVAATPGAVLMAPGDSNHLFAFDPRTGALLWRQSRQPSPSAAYHWFLGAVGDRAWVLGTKLQCLDVTNGGKPVWTGPEAGRLAPPRETAGPALGVGLLTADSVWALANPGLVRLDARTGAFVSATRLPVGPEDRGRARPAGDLVAGDGALLVVSDRSIDCHYRFEDLRDRLRARLAAAPDDPSLRLEAGEVFRVAGELDEAISCLERGLATTERSSVAALARVDAALRRSLHGALLARSRARHAVGDSLGAYEDLERAVDVARDRGDAVRALFSLAEATGTGPNAAVGDAALRRIADEFGDVSTELRSLRVDAGPAARFELAQRAAATGRIDEAIGLWMDLVERAPEGDLGTASVAVAVRQRLDALAESGGEDVRRRIDDRARASFDAAANAKDVAGLVRIARTSPSASVAADAGVLASSALLAAGRAREAAAVLEGLLQRPQPPQVASRALWALANAYEALEELPRERHALRRLAAFPEDVALGDGRGAAAAAREALRAERFREAPAALPDPRPPLGLLWETVGTDDPPLQLVTVQGTRPRGLEGRLLFVQDRVATLVDGRGGDEAWRADLGLEIRAAFGARTAVVFVGDDPQVRARTVRVESLRTEDGERQWVRRLPGKYVASASSLGIVYVLRQGVTATGERETTLTALSAETGEAVAERPLAGTVCPLVTASGDAVVVYEQIQAGQDTRRRAVTLDGSTLSPRGATEVEGWTSLFSFSPPGTNVVVTTARHDTVVAIDASTGAAAWPPFRLEGRTVKAVLPLPGAIVVTDDGDQVRRIDAQTGKQTWLVPLGGEANLGYAGEAADGDLVVATLVATRGEESATAVGLDGATGEVRWRTRLPLEGPVRRVLPRPEVLAGHVAYELNEKPDDEYRSKVVLLDRGTGAVADRIAHPVIGKTLQRAFFDGAFVVLWAPPRADVAVYGAGADGR